MDWPWVILFVLFVCGFAALETLAFRHPDRINTLSTAITTIGERWPFSIWLLGFLCGALAAHLFWPWSANPLGPGAG